MYVEKGFGYKLPCVHGIVHIIHLNLEHRMNVLER